MAIKDPLFIDTEDKELVKVQQNFIKYARQLNPVVLDGRFLLTVPVNGREVELTINTTTTLIPHGLGRKFQGWNLLDIQGDARVWRDTSSNSDSSKFLPLKASAAVVVKLWVF